MKNEEILKQLKEALESASGPLCASYEYDPTPTAEERLKQFRTDVNEVITSIEDTQQ